MSLIGMLFFDSAHFITGCLCKYKYLQKIQVNLTKSFIIRRVEKLSRSVIWSCGSDQEGRSWETGIEEVGFEVLPERCNKGAISYLEGEGVL